LHSCYGLFDQHFGLRPWNQHRRGNGKLKSAEEGTANQISQWLARLAPCKQRGKSFQLIARQFAFGMSNQIGV